MFLEHTMNAVKLPILSGSPQQSSAVESLASPPPLPRYDRPNAPAAAGPAPIPVQGEIMAKIKVAKTVIELDGC